VIAVYAATLGKPGIVVNAGTGSFAAGIGPKGETIRAGGWGNIVDDEGSAYDIGKLGIRAALRTHDGREPRTAIRKLLMSGMRLRNLEDVIYDIYEKPMTVDEISAISRLVARAADGGDKIARGIFAYEGRVLANLVSAIAKRLKITSERPDIYCVGGVFRSGTILLKPFKRELRKSVPAFTLRRPRFDPVIGAFVLAMKQEGVLVSGQVVTNLKSSYARHAENVR
jgi:N-acetylglucosamine kinase